MNVNPEFWEWNAERYRELNAYFRVRIKVLLESDPYLKEMISKAQTLELHHITGRMSKADQEIWQEFLELDRAKFYLDMQDHLEGRGTPFNIRTGFGKTNRTDTPDEPTW